MRVLRDKEIVVATHNDGKKVEINDLLAPYGLKAKSSKDHGLSEPIEDGKTFEENAYIKAFFAAKLTNMPALSDDSGLCIDALEGAPGIHTAEFAEKPDGSGRDFNYAMLKLENELNEVGASEQSDRGASFVAVLCLCWPDGHAEYFRGECTGTIVWPPRGPSGFGYDPIFQPEGHDITFGEMDAQQKHGLQAGSNQAGLSHRAKAFAKFATTCLENIEVNQ